MRGYRVLCSLVNTLTRQLINSSTRQPVNLSTRQLVNPSTNNPTLKSSRHLEYRQIEMSLLSLKSS